MVCRYVQKWSQMAATYSRVIGCWQLLRAKLALFQDLEPKSRIWGPYGRQGRPQTSPGAFGGVWGRLETFLMITRISHTFSMTFSHIRPLLHRFCLTDHSYAIYEAKSAKIPNLRFWTFFFDEFPSSWEAVPRFPRSPRGDKKTLCWDFLYSIGS